MLGEPNLLFGNLCQDVEIEQQFVLHIQWPGGVPLSMDITAGIEAINTAVAAGTEVRNDTQAGIISFWVDEGPSAYQSHFDAAKTR